MTDFHPGGRETLESVAANLRIHRRSRDYTQEQLAELASTSVFTIQALERARGTNHSLLIVVRIAHALACTIDDLLRPATFIPARPGRPLHAPKPLRQSPD